MPYAGQTEEAMTRVLVVGATGFLGGEICRRLVIRGKPVCALVRHTADPAKIACLQALGVTCTYGDLKERSSLDAACQGATAVITTATSTFSRQPDDSLEATDRSGQCNLVAAAQMAGVQHFIYTSYSRALDCTDPCPLTLAKRTVEQQVVTSGLTYTILCPSYFSEVFLSPLCGFDYVNATATIYGAGHNTISWIARGDVAEFAVQSLDNPHACNAVLELGGPQALSPLEVVTIFEEQSGRPFGLTYLPVAALWAQKAAATNSLQQSFLGMLLAYAAGNPIQMDATRSLFSVSLTSVRDYARRVLAAQ